jgi:hypothetical protein
MIGTMIAAVGDASRWRSWLYALLLCGALLLLDAGPARAQGAPQWTISSIANPTDLAPGDDGDQLIVTAINTGQGIAEGGVTPIAITDTVPVTGMTLDPAGVAGAKGGFPSGAAMQCRTTPAIVCSTTEAIIPGDVLKMVLTVDVAAGAPDIVFNQVSISGGGAPEASVAAPVAIGPAPAGAGIAPGSFVTARSSSRAGARPNFTAAFALATKSLDIPAGPPQSLALDLPPGIVDEPDSFSRCPMVEVTEASCPRATVLGRAFVSIQASPGEPGALDFPLPIYNIAPEAGEPAAFAFDIPGDPPVRLDLSLAPLGGYHLHAAIAAAGQARPLLSTVLTLWGVPADLNGAGPSSGFGGPGPGPRVPLLTNPTFCGGPLTTTLSPNAGEGPGGGPAVTSDLIATDECGLPGFEPSFTVSPETAIAASPSGLLVNLRLPQDNEPDAVASSHLKRAIVTLPSGLDLNTAAANGLQACSPAQVGLSSEPGASPIAFTAAAANCPDASRIGSVEVDTSLFDRPLSGSIYLAAQGDNPFQSLLAIYLAVADPETGVVIKLAGDVAANLETGQLAASFEESPQLPFEDLRLDFFGGPRAALSTPPTCGEFTTEADLTPWTSPAKPDATLSDPFTISSSPDGGACATTPAAEPNHPGFSAGTLAPGAGAYSPFVLHLSRADGSQELQALNLTLPPGLLGTLAGIPPCSDAQIAAAEAHSGVAEQQSPSCPAAAQVGTIRAGAGAGPEPFYASGKIYLAGPYKGAPLSLASITPAVAGPFDLGTVVDRVASFVNPETAQIRAVTDTIPHIRDGIPLDIRSIAVSLDRPNFIFNPTNCAPMSIGATTTTLLGQSADLSSPFQASGCQSLPFKPQLKLSLKGGTRRNRFPALKAVLTAKPGEANSAAAQVILPHSEFIEQGHIRTVCTRVQFAAEECPAASIYGHAKVITPLLDFPEEGPVYLRSSNHLLPDLVVALKGPAFQPIEIDLDGHIDSVHSRVRTTFEVIPDAPITKFVLSMPGGKRGLLVNSTNLCKSANRANIKLTGQNGKTRVTRPVVSNSCPRKGHHKKKRSPQRGGRQRR